MMWSIQAFARQTIVQSLWDLTGTILDLPENCGQAGVREMYFRCIQVGLRLSEARVRAGNLSTAAMNARIARGIPVSADEAQKYARTIHLSVFQPMALGALEGMLAECKAVAGTFNALPRLYDNADCCSAFFFARTRRR